MTFWEWLVAGAAFVIGGGLGLIGIVVGIIVVWLVVAWIWEQILIIKGPPPRPPKPTLRNR